jgi:hypothetical protein
MENAHMFGLLAESLDSSLAGRADVFPPFPASTLEHVAKRSADDMEQCGTLFAW